MYHKKVSAVELSPGASGLMSTLTQAAFSRLLRMEAQWHKMRSCAGEYRKDSGCSTFDLGRKKNKEIKMKAQKSCQVKSCPSLEFS